MRNGLTENEGNYHHQQQSEGLQAGKMLYSLQGPRSTERSCGFCFRFRAVPDRLIKVAGSAKSSTMIHVLQRSPTAHDLMEQMVEGRWVDLLLLSMQYWDIGSQHHGMPILLTMNETIIISGRQPPFLKSPPGNHLLTQILVAVGHFGALASRVLPLMRPLLRGL